MRKLLLLVWFCVMASGARAETVEYPIADALRSDHAGKLVKPDVALFFADQMPARPAKVLSVVDGRQRAGIGIIDNGPKDASFPNSFTGNADRNARDGCVKAFLLMLRDLQGKARAAGGDAVVEIRDSGGTSGRGSASHFVCRHGGWRATVSLKGKAVKLAKP